MPSMIMMVLLDLRLLEDVVDAWYTAGSCGVTVLESSGARHLLGSGPRATICPSFHRCTRCCHTRKSTTERIHRR